jgi:hypothetical protein
MATKTAAKKSPKKKPSAKIERRPLSMEFCEVVKCFIMSYEIVERSPMLIYMKYGDRTIHATWVHPDTDLKVMKKCLKMQEKYQDDSPLWISLWKEADLCKENIRFVASQMAVRSIAETFEEATAMFFDPKTKGFNQMAFNVDIDSIEKE